MQLCCRPSGTVSTNSPEESLNDVIRLRLVGRERVSINVFLEKLLDKVGYWTRFYQAKKFCYYRKPDSPMKVLAKSTYFDQFKLVTDPCGLNRLYYQCDEKYVILIIDSPIYNGYKSFYCGCVCFYDKYICKHVVALTIHLNLIVKGISEDRNLIEKFIIRSKPGKKLINCWWCLDKRLNSRTTVKIKLQAKENNKK